MAKAEDRSSDVAQRDRRMTVAVVDEQAAHATVRFLESARLHRLPRASTDYAASLRVLQSAVGTGAPVCVRLEAPHSEIIAGVRASR